MSDPGYPLEPTTPSERLAQAIVDAPDDGEWEPPSDSSPLAAAIVNADADFEAARGDRPASAPAAPVPEAFGDEQFADAMREARQQLPQLDELTKDEIADALEHLGLAGVPAQSREDLLTRTKAVFNTAVAYRATEQLNEQQQDEALSDALEQLELADYDEARQVADNLVASAPDRLEDFLAAWAEDDFTAAEAYRLDLLHRVDAAQVQFAEQQQFAEALERAKAADTAAQAMQQALTGLLREKADAAKLVPMMEEVAATSGEQMYEPGNEAGYVQGLYKVAREASRAEAVATFKRSILGADGFGLDGKPIALEPVEVPVEVNPRNVIPSRPRNEALAAFKERIVANDEQAGVKAMMGGFRAQAEAARRYEKELRDRGWRP